MTSSLFLRLCHFQFQKTSVDDCKPLNNSQRVISHSEERASVDECKPLNNSQREISHTEERVDAGSIKSSEKFVQSHVTFDTPKSRSEVDKSYSLHFDLKDLRKRREQKQSRMQLIGSTTLEECKGKRYWTELYCKPYKRWIDFQLEVLSHGFVSVYCTSSFSPEATWLQPWTLHSWRMRKQEHFQLLPMSWKEFLRRKILHA